MPRHHNKAILAAITEQGLDPTKAYVTGKNGLTLSTSELKKRRSPVAIPVSPLSQIEEKETAALKEVVPPKEKEEEKEVVPPKEKEEEPVKAVVDMPQEQSDLTSNETVEVTEEEKTPVKDSKFKKKAKAKVDQTADQS